MSDQNPEQAKYWNADAGQKWVRFQDDLDGLLEGVNARLLSRANISPGEKIFDVGCGTGATTMAAADLTGPTGKVIGIDISDPMLVCAESRIPENQTGIIQYLLADAQALDFGARGFDAYRFDLLVSRLGMMFFDDPVTTFKNLARALRPGGRMAFVCWGAANDNPWFSVPRDAAIERLGTPSRSDSSAPGPLAFANSDHVLEIMREAGLAECRAEPEQVDLIFPGSLEDAAILASSVGPAVRIVKEFDGTAEDIEAIEKMTADGLRRFVTDGGVQIPATMNFFDAIRV